MNVTVKYVFRREAPLVEIQKKDGTRNGKEARARKWNV
jgi:hypothetical protein